jgi:hypothetical protein
MKDFPTDPIRQNNRLIAAFCDDLWDMCLNGGTGTPRADRICEISRQINEQPRDGSVDSNALPTNQ